MLLPSVLEPAGRLELTLGSQELGGKQQSKLSDDQLMHKYLEPSVKTASACVQPPDMDDHQ